MCNWRLRSSFIPCLSCALVLFVAGCRTTSHAQDGALLGAGLGTAAGAIIGHQSGHTQGGALLGALTGAVVGGIAGDAEDARDERDAAIAHSQYQQEEAAYRASKVAVNNLDLIDMADAGLSDQVILNAIQTRGGQLDLSPSAIIELKQHRVSDAVILSLQQSNRGYASPRPNPYAYSSTTVITPAPTVYIAPRPAIGISIGARPYYRYHGHHGPYHRHYGPRW